MNIWQITGKIQISIQIVFWTLYIYLCNFDLIFECFQNSITQFIILLIFVFHQICALRNFYLGISTSSEIKEKNDSIQNTICKKCGKDRPPRSHHCSICNKCIERMDHHCYFMNNCIGKKNYKYFFRYLLFSFINSSGGIILGFYRFYIFKYFEFGNIRKSFKLRLFFGFLKFANLRFRYSCSLRYFLKSTFRSRSHSFTHSGPYLFSNSLILAMESLSDAPTKARVNGPSASSNNLRPFSDI